MAKTTSKQRTFTTKLIVAMLGIFILISACCITTYHLLGYGCWWWECAPKRTFTVYDLSMPRDILSEEFDPIILHPDRGIVGAVEEAIGESEGLAIYIIDRFATVRKASEWYSLNIELKLFTSPLDNPSQVSRVLNFKSEIADEYRVACGYIARDLRCIFDARYHEYYVFFNGFMGEEKFSQDGFLDAISYIDQKFGELLEGNQ